MLARVTKFWADRKLSAILIMLINLITINGYAAEPHQIAKQNVVRLRSAVRSYCASGVLLRTGEILTAAHVAQALCTRGICHNLVVGITENWGQSPQEHTGISYKVSSQVEGLDLAVLAPPGDTTIRGTLELQQALEPAIVESSEKQTVAVASYPGCRKLEITQGELVDANALGFKTTALGGPGSSGGAIFTSDGRWAGLATRAVSEFAALWGRLTGSQFALRGRTITTKILQEPHTPQGLTAQLKLYRRFWEQELALLDDAAQRKWLSLELINAAQGFSQSALRAHITDQEALRPLLALHDYPGFLIDTILTDTALEKVSNLQKSIERFVLMVTLENQGLRKDFQTAIDVSKTVTLLNQQGREDLSTVLLVAEQHPYDGARLSWLAFGILLTLLAIPTLLVYSASLGFVVAKESGLARLKYFLIVALLAWPLSFLAYLIRLWRKNRNSSEAARA